MPAVNRTSEERTVGGETAMNGTRSASWHALHPEVSVVRPSSIAWPSFHSVRHGGLDLVELILGIAPVPVAPRPVEFGVTVANLDHCHVEAAQMFRDQLEPLVDGALEPVIRLSLYGSVRLILVPGLTITCRYEQWRQEQTAKLSISVS